MDRSAARWTATAACLVVLLSLTPAAVTPARAAEPSARSVREAQQTLEALQLDPGPADGILGPRTKTALRRFQEAEKLSATGALDEETRGRLAERRRQHVVQLQQALKQTGHDPGPVDGVLGSQTKAALQRYAAAPAPTGRSGPSETIERLRRAYETSLQQSP